MRDDLLNCKVLNNNVVENVRKLWVNKELIMQWNNSLLSAAFENPHEATEFVKCKIESLVANVVVDTPKEGMNLYVLQYSALEVKCEAL